MDCRLQRVKTVTKENDNIQSSLPLPTAALMFLYCPFVYGGSDNSVSLSVKKRLCGEEPHVTGSALP